MKKVRLITDDFNGDIHKWCNENFGITEWSRQGVAVDPVKFLPVIDYIFWNDVDAVLFALKWK